MIVSLRSENSEQIASFRAFLPYFVRPRMVNTADNDTVLSAPSGEDVGRSSDDDSETELTIDVRPKGVESIDDVRDLLGPRLHHRQQSSGRRRQSLDIADVGLRHVPPQCQN